MVVVVHIKLGFFKLTGKTICNFKCFCFPFCAQEDTNNTLDFLGFIDTIEVVNDAQQDQWMDNDLKNFRDLPL